MSADANRKDVDPPSEQKRGRILNFVRQREPADAVLREFQPHALAIEETPPSPFTGILLWGAVGLFLAALVWSWFSQIPIMTTAPARFMSDARTKVVQSLNPGTVREIRVKPGEAVTAGQILVALDPEVDRAKLVSTGKDLGLNGLKEQRVLAELGQPVKNSPVTGATQDMARLERNVASAQLAALRSKIEGDSAQVQEAKANLEAGKATLAEYLQRLDQDRDLAKSAEPLVAEGALSGAQYTQLKDQVIVDEGQLAAQRQQVGQLLAAVSAADKQLELDRRNFEADRYQDLETAVGKDYDLSSQYAQASRDATLDMLRAPTNGTVQSVDVASLGTVLQAGQTVATIVPSDAPLIVEVDLPAQDIGFVKVGEKTLIKVTAYPFEQYGSIPGKVIWVSPTAESTSTLSSLPEGDSHQPPTPSNQLPQPSGDDEAKGAAPPTLYYRVKVQPDRAWLTVEGQRRPMMPGMTASVDIETGHRRVLEFFLDPVIKYVNNGIVVR